MREIALEAKKPTYMGAALTLGLATLLTRIATFVTQAVIAKQFGASYLSDAYFVSENVLVVLSDFIVIDFGIAFIPLWMEYKTHHGIEEAKKFANALISVASVATILVAAIITLVSPILLRLVAPGFDAQAMKTANMLLVAMAPAVIFLGLTAGCTGLLESHRFFTIPELSRLAYRVTIVMVVILLAERLGVIALAWGTVAGSLIRLLFQLPNTFRLKVLYFSKQLKHPGVYRVAKLVIPIFIANAGVRVTMLLGGAVASTLSEGSVSGLSYASRVMLLPVGLLALPLRTTIFPSLSKFAAEKRLELLGKTAGKGLGLLAFFTAPICAGLILLQTPIIQLLFQRGEFNQAATQLTASALGWLAVGLPAFSGMMIVNSIFFSMSDPKPVIRFNLFNWFFGLLLSVVLAKWWGTSGIAFSISLSTILTLIFAFSALKKKLTNYSVKPLLTSLGKSLLAALLMSIVVFFFQRYLLNVVNSLTLSPTMVTLGVILCSGIVGLITYVLAALALGVDEAREQVKNILNLLGSRI